MEEQQDDLYVVVGEMRAEPCRWLLVELARAPGTAAELAERVGMTHEAANELLQTLTRFDVASSVGTGAARKYTPGPKIDSSEREGRTWVTITFDSGSSITLGSPPRGSEGR